LALPLGKAELIEHRRLGERVRVRRAEAAHDERHPIAQRAI
jgi:hypothetical protein